ncbi:MAG: ATP-binding protein [Treponema sp.]|nr:ATP-binding protein [Treponema sp.]
MQEFSKRVSQKLDKLSSAQIQRIIEDNCGKTELFSSIFQSLQSGLVIVDEKFLLININKAAERYLPLKSSFDKFSDDEPVFNYIDDDEISKFLKDCLENGKTNVSSEYTVKTSGGSVRFIDIFVTPLVQGQSNDQTLLGSIIRIEDVTERKQQEILLHRMETLAGLTNIAASVAHEIKNPLGAISIHIQLIQKMVKKKRDFDGKLPDPKFLENYLDVINQEIENLNKIVVDFLMAVRPISANLELVNPDKLLKSIFDFFGPELKSKKIKTEISLNKEDLRILIDQKLFREIIVNLATNSVSAIESKNEADMDLSKDYAGIISVKTSVKDDKYTILFSDNGCGMSEETVSRIFEPYFTTKANGTGLGMAMSYKIIKEFSGDIAVESKLGEGSSFKITLPVPQKDKRLLTFKEKDQKRIGVKK